MLRRIGGLSGFFVLLTLGWYLVFPFKVAVRTPPPQRRRSASSRLSCRFSVRFHPS